MSHITTDLYKKINSSVEDINKKIASAAAELESIRASRQINIPARIERYEQLLEKIDDYELKVKAFQELAKRNLNSQNVLTIEAPPGYRVNLNRLKKWAMLIDPSSDNDPYAQRVLAVAKCDECFLEQKRVEFTKRIQELKADQDTGLTAEMQQLEDQITNLKARRSAVADSEDVFQLAKATGDEHAKYRTSGMPESFVSPDAEPKLTAFGCKAIPFNVGTGSRSDTKTLFGDYYDPERGLLYLPYELDAAKEHVLSVRCTPSGSKIVDKALQNWLFRQIESSPAGTRRIYVVDGLRFNSNSMGSLRKLEGSFAMEHIPRNPDQLTTTLENLVASFADMDDVLEMYDSVREYNTSGEATQKLPYTTLLIYGWPGAFSERDKEMLRRVMINYERYGITCIIVSLDTGSKRKISFDLSEYAMQNAISVDMTGQDYLVRSEEGTYPFKWYTLEEELPDAYAESVKSIKIGEDSIGNEYTDRYSLIDRPQYVRTYKRIEMPIGIDGKEQEQSIDFENENFATYLVGASRSGKSTLLHTIIAGLIRNYHPDNVELWLADFKQLEFKRYMKHIPPHVKYVLLDESPELVYDLVDKLTDEMMERQRLFSRLGKQRIDQIDTTALDKPLPVIFVILDEFSIMSQSIAESPIYKQRLQNLLAKGAALGIKFLFSSQTFTTGVAGLTSTARAQIQQRIAMKGTIDEITSTLELSANIRTDQVKNWMEALPPHYALIKYRLGADTLPMVKRLLVLYFRDYEPRDRMIDDINRKMHAVEKYMPGDLASYVDKKPVMVDGNSYSQFTTERLGEYLNTHDKTSDEFMLDLGVPRLMVPMKPAVLSAETRENVLMIARSAEQACAASILMSAARSFIFEGGHVRIWAYPKNPLYTQYKDLFRNLGIRTYEGMDEICDDIREVRKSILERRDEKELIIMIGMERICMDFEFVDSTQKPVSGEKIEMMKKFDAAALTEDGEEKQKYAQAWVKRRIKLKKELAKIANSAQHLNELLAKAEAEFRDEYFKNREAELKEMMEKQMAEKAEAPAAEEKKEAQAEEPPQKGAYNAAEDFTYIVKQGSRNGIHFMLALNSFADLKTTGVKADVFRHKLLFQIPIEDSRALFGNKSASLTPEHICVYDDTMSRFSFRPYIHQGIGWEGWFVDERGVLVSPFVESDF